jgi:hypothetical protein
MGAPLLTVRMPAGRLPTVGANEGYPRTSPGKAGKAGGELWSQGDRTLARSR